MTISRHQHHSIRLAVAAIQMSFSGIGLPFAFSRCLRRPYSRATSISGGIMAISEAKRSTRVAFSDSRLEFAAPKNSSPSTAAGTNTSPARSTFASNSHHLPSGRLRHSYRAENLPLIGVNLLAPLFNACLISRAETGSRENANLRNVDPPLPAGHEPASEATYRSTCSCASGGSDSTRLRDFLADAHLPTSIIAVRPHSSTGTSSPSRM